MKIDNSVGSVGGLTGSESKPRQSKGPASAPAASGEKVELSSLASQMQEVEAALANVPVVDSGRVAEIKQAIAEGQVVQVRTASGQTLSGIARAGGVVEVGY